MHPTKDLKRFSLNILSMKKKFYEDITMKNYSTKIYSMSELTTKTNILAVMNKYSFYRKPLPSILGINLKFNRNSIWNSSHRNHVKNLYCLQQAVAEAEYFELKPRVGAEIEVGYLNHLKHNALITGIVESELE
ncbi:hypothetical protein BpHYR1_042353 [Brachionus plicatilis]|uniref:Uncharacterized protein n=1 Tax=Brachionus plicatilis TaxID=10195 RepID=A0A3M7SV16_BRAPC|nr:hypothetical protein BpHYR1_042353 [Brachionus plicatilis]